MKNKISLKLLLVFIVAISFISCFDKGWNINDVKDIAVGAGDSIFFISKKDKHLFSVNCKQTSLIRDEVALIQKEEKFGYADEDGEQIIPDVYKYATVFNNNMAWVVRSGDVPGVINRKGELKFSLREVDWVEVYIEDMARYYTIEKRQKRYGFANTSGEKVIMPLYYDATSFSEGLAAVKGVDGKWGYIDKNGVVIIPANFDVAKIFVNERAVVAIEDKWGVIDKTGEFILEPKFEDMTADGELFITLSNDKWGWTDIEGNWVINPEYEKVLPFRESDLAPVMIDGKWAYINKNGEIEIKRQFDEAYPFVDYLALVKIGDYYGFINDDGVYKINPQYRYISPDYISNAIYGLPFYSSVMSDR
ncbi:MAG: WG repeat-containing protein [Bacteroidales bacterium]|nr:WG repeat-containing protein [Bacteroidales bacterium]